MPCRRSRPEVVNRRRLISWPRKVCQARGASTIRPSLGLSAELRSARLEPALLDPQVAPRLGAIIPQSGSLSGEQSPDGERSQ